MTRRVSHNGHTVAIHPTVQLSPGVKLMLVTLKIGSFLSCIGGAVAIGFVWGAMF